MDKNELSWNAEAESAVLGGVLLQPDVIRQVCAIVSPSDFYTTPHQLIFDAMLTLESKKQPIDIMTLAEQLRKTNNLDNVGGVMALDALSDGVVTIANIKHYAEMVQNHANIRKMRIFGIESLEITKNQSLDASQIHNRISDLWKSIDINDKGSSLAVEARDYVSEARDAALSLEPPQGVVKSGMGVLDTEFGGLQASTFYVVAARPSMGKSTFVLNCVVNAGFAGNRIILYTFEESKRTAMWRMMSCVSGVPLSNIFKRNMSLEQRDAIVSASELITAMDLQIIDRPMSSRAICDHTEAENGRKKVDLVVIDIMTKVREDPKLRPYERISRVSNTLSQLPGAIEAPVVAVHQLNRGVESRDIKVPELSDLRESGSIEEDAKGIIFLMRPNYYDESADASMLIARMAKNSNGPCGKFALYCDMARMKIKGGK
jgi:replicative DNA helicase